VNSGVTRKTERKKERKDSDSVCGSSGPVLAMVLEKPNAVAEWRSLIGPTDSQQARLDAPDRCCVPSF
jgi:nucleoside diphosphate kinase